MKEKAESYSPKGVLEDYFRSSDSETSSEKEPTPDSETQQNSKQSSRWRGLVKLLTTKSKKPLATTVHPLLKFSKRMSSSMREITGPKFQADDAELMYPFKSPWKNFSLYELQAATKSFSHENLIGKGGYAEVFKGCLSNGELVAIKRLTRGQEEITGDFLAEIGVMAHVKHPNTARLIGYGVEGGMHLVLELSTKGSLASVLYGSEEEKLDWSIRYKIAIGAAKGLQYLHEGCQRRIIHRDIKAANIPNFTDFISIMASDDPKAVEAEPPPSSWKERIVFPTLLAGILGGGAGLVSKHRKVMGLPTSCATYAANFAIVTACYCGAREYVGVTRKTGPDDLVNSAIAGFGTGAILGRLQGGRIGAVRYSIIFTIVGTTVDYATIRLRPVLKSYKESMLGSNDGSQKNEGWLKMPDWSPIKVLDEEALAAKQAREQKVHAQRVALGNLSKEES